jgi:hypothetical protein
LKATGIELLANRQSHHREIYQRVG